MYLVNVCEVPGLVDAQMLECVGRLTVDAPPVEVDMKVLERWHEKDAVVQRVDLADTVKGIREVLDRKSTRLNSSHSGESRMPSSA